MRSKRAYILFSLIIASALYSASYATLDSQFLLKSLTVLLPIQVGACIYLVYAYWTGKLTRKN